MCHILPFSYEYHHAKNQRYLRILSIDTDDLKIQWSDWIRVLWTITCEAELSQIWGFHTKTENWLFLAKNNDKILWQLKKTLLWGHLGPFLPVLRQTRTVLENPLLALFTTSRFLLLCKISHKKKMMNKLQSYGRTDAHTDKHEFIGVLSFSLSSVKLRILRNFSKQLYYRTHRNGCFGTS